MDEKLQIIISAQVADLQKGCEEAKKQVGTIGKETQIQSDKMAKAFSNIGKAIVAAFSVNAIKNFLGECSAAYNESIQNEAKLTEIMKTRIGASDEQIESVKRLASEQQKLGVVEDDTAVAGAQQLATFATNTDTINTLLPAMENLAVQQNGVNVTGEQMTGIANLMGKALQGQTGALTKVGISFDESQEKILKYGTESERAAVLAQVVTDNVGNMNAALAQTPEGKMQQLKNTLGDLKETVGGALAPVLTQIATGISDFIATHQPQIDNFQNSILPAITEALQKIFDNVSTAFNFIIDNWPTISQLLEVAAILIGAVVIATTAYNICAGIKAAMDAAQVTTLGALIAANISLAAATLAATWPILAIIAGIAALIAIIVLCIKHWDDIKATASNVINAVLNWIKGAVETIKGIFNSVVNFFSGIFQSIGGFFTNLWNSITNIFGKVFDTISKPFTKAQDFIKNVIEKIKGFFDFKWDLPKIKMPHISINGKFSLVPPSIPKFSIDWYANGGIFNKPTIFNTPYGLKGVGEAGAEAVAPLAKLEEFINNAVATNGGRGNAPTTIVLKVGEREFGSVVVDSINSITAQTGELPLAIGI